MLTKYEICIFPLKFIKIVDFFLQLRHINSLLKLEYEYQSLLVMFFFTKILETEKKI